MPRAKEPIDILTAKGKSHMTREQILEREIAELKPERGDISAPDYLTTGQKKRFDHYAARLDALDIFKDLDVDCLARYIIAHDNYLKYTKEAEKEKTMDARVKINNMADKAFNQAHKCAMALGLTIVGRCKLSIPKAEEDDEL